MTPISNTFFVTGLGRSGTKFLATLLQRSDQFRVVHEWKLRGTRLRDRHLKHFPLYRFWLARYPFAAARKGYGEVNSHLRKVLKPDALGPEARIPKRAIIERDPRDVIASAMNRRNRNSDDFAPLCEAVVRDYVNLQLILSEPGLGYDRFSFTQMTRDAAYLQQIVEWAGISDLQVTSSDVAHKVNENKVNWFPRHEEWDDEQRQIFLLAIGSYGDVVTLPFLRDK